MNARYQNVFGIETARFQAPWGEVPIVATCELERITLFAWNDGDRKWDHFERGHTALTTDARDLQDSTRWNWSRRVSVVSTRDAVLLVYKRAHSVEKDTEIRLTIDRFEPNGESLRLTDTIDLPTLPSDDRRVGFSLWAGMDAKRDRLLLLTQVAKGDDEATELEWELFLFTLPLDDLQDTSRWTETRLTDGGFDLDARVDGNRLIAIHRESAAAVRFPFPLQSYEIASGPDADLYYVPLTLTTVNLETMAVELERLPGGAHPQLQRLDPLIITFDRQQRTAVGRDVFLPLPPQQPRILWQPTAIDKVAFVRLDGGDARGAILSTEADVLPRTFAPFAQAMHLLAADDGLPGHASPLAVFPGQLLEVEVLQKEIVFDILHHRAFVGLVRTRARADIADGELLVSASVFEVWDIGHAQIDTPADRTPDADAENRQFAPFDQPASTTSEIAFAPPWRLDNTMGGHVAADVQGTPRGFFAYSDMGDGGLRVIFASEVRPLPEPPPIDNEKILLPENVTGPRVPGEEWVQIDIADAAEPLSIGDIGAGWIDSELPGYFVGAIGANSSLGSATEVAIDVLLDGVAAVNDEGATPDGAPIQPLFGMNEAQLAAIDAFRSRNTPPSAPIDMVLTDGRTIQVVISPGTVIEEQPVEFSATLDGTLIFPILWTFVPQFGGTPLPDGPLHPSDFAGPLPPTGPFPIMIGAATNPATISFPTAARWRMSVFLPVEGATARPPGAVRQVAVEDSVTELVWAMHDGLETEETEEFVDIGDLSASLLKYDFAYDVDDAGERVTASITTLPRRATQMRFLGGGDRQGAIDYRMLISIETTDLRLQGLLGVAFAFNLFHVDLVYSRPFTPGVLMDDQRAFDSLRGGDLEDAPFHTVTRRNAQQHAGLAAKPIGDSRLEAPTMNLSITATPAGALLSVLIPVLALLGATAIAGIVLGLAQLIGVLAALGPGAIVIAAAAAVVLVVLVTVVIPRLAERYVFDTLARQLSAPEAREDFDRLGLLRYAGEGLAEAIARRILKRAVGLGMNVSPPSEDEGVGLDRFRGQTFQMMFVSVGVCRVLVRTDE